MTLVLRLALNTLVIPVAPVALGLAAARAVRSPAMRRNAGAVAAASGIVVAHLVDVGVPQFPPLDTIGWIPFGVAVATAGLLLESRPALRVALAFAVATTATRLVGRPVWISVSDAALWAMLAGVVTAAVDASHAIARRWMPPAATLLALAMTMASGSIACLFGHSALLAQVLGASAVVVGAAGVVAIFIDPASTVTSIAALSAVAVMVYARLYARLPTLVAALLLASAAAPMFASAFPLGRRARGGAAACLAVALGAAAVFCARP